MPVKIRVNEALIDSAWVKAGSVTVTHRALFLLSPLYLGRAKSSRQGRVITEHLISQGREAFDL